MLKIVTLVSFATIVSGLDCTEGELAPEGGCDCPALTCKDGTRFGGDAAPECTGETFAASYHCEAQQECHRAADRASMACLNVIVTVEDDETSAKIGGKCVEYRGKKAYCDKWGQNYYWCYTADGWGKCAEDNKSPPKTIVVPDANGNIGKTDTDNTSTSGKTKIPAKTPTGQTPPTGQKPQTGQTGAASYGISAAAIMTFMTFFF